MKRYLVVLLLTITILGCGELWKLVPIDPGNKPVILDSYAPQNSFVSIQEEEGEHLAGYIFVKTPRSSSLQGKMFHVTIFVQDKEGRKSKSVGFLLHFTEESEAESELPEKWQHPSTNKLGGIFSDYFVEYVRELTSPRE